MSASARPPRNSGRLTRAAGLVLEAVGLHLPVGSDCLIELPPGYPQRMPRPKWSASPATACS